MKHMARTLVVFLLALVLVIGLVPGMGLTAYADSTTWSANQNITATDSINGGVKVTADITLTIAKDATLTVNGGIDAGSNTLTVKGKGTLIVIGANGNNGSDGGFGAGGSGANGGNGFVGNIIVDGATVTITSGNGGKGGGTMGPTHSGSGGNGGTGVVGDVTVKKGAATISGGKGGNGGDCSASSGTRDNGGDGGNGVTGNVTVISGTAFVSGGNGGNVGPGSGTPGTNGNIGKAVSGSVDGSKIEESADNSTWSTVSGGSSEKRYVKADIPFIDISGVTLDKTTVTLTVSGTETLTATVKPENAMDKTVTWESSAPAVATVSDEGFVTAVSVGTATITATATNGTDETDDDKTATCAVTVNKPDSTVKKAPEAKSLTYNGQAQALVTAGEADGGTLYYAVTTENKAPTDEKAYAASIPTATDAGT